MEYLRLESKIFGVFYNLGQGLQERSQISTIYYPMICCNIHLQILHVPSVRNCKINPNTWCRNSQFGERDLRKITCIWLFMPIRPSLVATTVGSDAPTAMIAPCRKNMQINIIMFILIQFSPPHSISAPSYEFCRVERFKF